MWSRSLHHIQWSSVQLENPPCRFTSRCFYVLAWEEITPDTQHPDIAPHCHPAVPAPPCTTESGPSWLTTSLTLHDSDSHHPPAIKQLSHCLAVPVFCHLCRDIQRGSYALWSVKLSQSSGLWGCCFHGKGTEVHTSEQREIGSQALRCYYKLAHHLYYYGTWPMR